MHDWQSIAIKIARVSGRPFKPKLPDAVGGGCISSAMLLADGDQRWFVKTNRDSMLDMFEAEFDGLRAMAGASGIKVPRPLCTGVTDGVAYIAMEHLALGGRCDMALAGGRLASMHRKRQARFGWHRDNTIGSTRQRNRETDDWVRFWREHRLGFQLDLAARNGYGGTLTDQGAELMELFGALMDHAPTPSLLHGDLWGGNFGCTMEGEPVIYDPACYFGDREADLAMTELFGGFGARFYSGYNAEWPLDSGYAVRKTLYNLYHILNHLNLFGGGYLAQARSMTQQLLAQLR